MSTSASQPSARTVDELLDGLAGMRRLVALTRERHRRAASDTPTRLQRFALMRVADEGTMPVSDLTGEFDVGAATMSQLIGTLERRGWVTRSLDPSDHRRHLVALTADGEAIVEAQRERQREVLRAVLAELTPEQRGHLLGIVQTIAGLALERPELFRGEL
jgi:DNA-binding MarR family transcriptional regulator